MRISVDAFVAEVARRPSHRPGRFVTIQVGIADDQGLLRGGLRLLVDSAPDIVVVGEAEDGLQAVELARAIRPDIILMDVQMPNMDGVEATRIISSDPSTSGTRVLILTTFDLDDYVFAALRAGASGFLLKDTQPERLIEAIRVVARGDALLDPAVTKRVVQAFAATPKPDLPADPSRLQELSTREREVLVAVARGWTNQEIAIRLHISTATAKTHVSRVLAKTGARDRVQLVIIAYETGLIGRL
jgi:DNA-binding NarL/FixJ family response regulator